MVFRYQKRYWWQLSSLSQQQSWEGHVVPKIEAHADITARDENYGWNDELLRVFNRPGIGIRHTQRKWPRVEPADQDPYGCRGHLRSANIRNAIEEGFDWILFNDADMVYDSQFFSHMLTLVDSTETRVYATDRWTMLFEDGYKIVDSVKYRGPIEDPVGKIEAGVTQDMWKSARGRISGAGFFQLVSVAGLKAKIAEDPGFADYVPPQYSRDHNTCDESQTHITRSDKKFRDRMGGIVAIQCLPQYHLNHWRRDKPEYDPEVLH